MISRRKLESYRRAELIARELRYQLCHHADRDDGKLVDLVYSWIQVTGKIKYERPGNQSPSGRN